jgi:hypothetical protein
VNGTAAVIVQQADEVSETIQCKESRRTHTREKERRTSSTHPLTVKESVASILERDASTTIEWWLARVRLTKELIGLTLADEERTEYRILPRNHRRHRSATAQSSRYRSDSGALIPHTRLWHAEDISAVVKVMLRL